MLVHVVVVAAVVEGADRVVFVKVERDDLREVELGFPVQPDQLAVEADVDNPSQYVGQLVTEEFGAELEKLRDRYYRYKDSLFCAYVRARPRMFPIGAGK